MSFLLDCLVAPLHEYAGLAVRSSRSPVARTAVAVVRWSGGVARCLVSRRTSMVMQPRPHEGTPVFDIARACGRGLRAAAARRRRGGHVGRGRQRHLRGRASWPRGSRAGIAAVRTGRASHRRQL